MRMNRFVFWTVCAITMILVLTLPPYGFGRLPAAHAETYSVPIIDDSFDRMTQPKGWAVNNANDPGNTAAIADGKLVLAKQTGNTNYLSLTKSLGSAFTPGPYHDKLAMEYKVQVVRADGAAIAFPLLADSSDGGRQPFNGQILPGTAGNAYKMHNGPSLQNVRDPQNGTVNFTFDPGKEYVFRHVLDYESGKHDLYIDGLLAASRFSFLNPVAGSDKVSLIIGGQHTEIRLAYFKVFRLTTQPPTDPVPQYPGFPVYQASKNKLLNGGVGGFGMLASYEAPGPKQVIVRRTTQVPANEPFKPITLARVFDPDGHLVAFHEFTDQETGADKRILDIPDGKAGVYRVSFSGGRDGDLLEIALPDTAIWGVRGEMALGVNGTTPRSAYLYLPRTANTFFLESIGVPTAEVYDDQGRLLGTPSNHNGRFTLTVAPVSADTVWQVKIDSSSTEALVFDGVPGLLTPTMEAALALKGGTLEADGLLVAGPAQAKVRSAMASLRQEELTVNLQFPDSVPEDLQNPIVEALNYGKYGFLMGMKPALDRQTLNPASPYYGAILDVDPNNRPNPLPEPPSWETFLHPAIVSPWDALNLANAVATPGALNPAYGNHALANRAALAAMYHLVSTQGDDYIRENNLMSGTPPLTHAFFAYYNVAKTYWLIKDNLSPEVRNAYRESLIHTGDRMGDYKGYVSNQWLHTIAGHLYTYMATGETRFLGYTERMLAAFVDGSFGPNSKFGQHPAGYFLEEYGPDGNYGSMNEYVLATLYSHYRRLPAADPVLVDKIKNAIQKDLDFQKFYWLPQPSGVANGTFVSPSAMNARTQSYLSVPTYPGPFLVAPEFPLALARYKLIKDPMNGAGDAEIFPHLINNDEWARRLLEWAVPKKDTYYDNTNGMWVYDLHEAYSKPVDTEPAVLPFEQDRGTWTLPGNVAWKRGPLYGSVFYDITGADSIPSQSRVGGGPAVLWSEGTGVVVNSTKNRLNGAVNSADDVSFTGIFGYDNDGKLFSSGKERSTFGWIQEGESFEIRSALAGPGGDLAWKYDLGEEETTITVTLNAYGKLHDTYVNLPIMMKEPDLVVNGPTNGVATFTLGNSSMAIAVPDGTEAVFGADISTFAGTIKPLRIALPADGTPLTIRVYATEQNDETPPTTTDDAPSGWVNRDVTVTLNASDGESGVAATYYTVDGGPRETGNSVTLTTEGTHTLTYWSADHAGNAEAARTVSVRIDKAAPSITVSMPEDGAVYPNSEDWTPRFAPTDSLSGNDPDETKVMLDSHEVRQDASIPLYTLPPGSHTFTVTTSDRAGNIGRTTVTFRTATSLETLKALVARFATAGWIDNAGIANSLQAKLNNGQLNGFMNQTEAQSGKHISAEAAGYLLRDARFMLAQ